MKSLGKKSFAQQILLSTIYLYQKTISPDHGLFSARFPYGFCRHYPSCSNYSKSAILKFGVLRGIKLTILRLVSCHPWAEPKVDLIPNK